MNVSKVYFSQVQAPVESKTVEEELVKFSRKWALWENYQAKSGTIDYSQSLKEVFNFNDIITFWQFWNVYPGSDPSNVFFNGERIRQ